MSISEKQLNANRENAKKSTGPKTEDGKNIVRRNASRHHITGQVFTMTDDDRAAYEIFTKGFMEDFKPAGALEITLVQSVADGYWRLNRTVAVENNTFALEAQANEHLVDAINTQVAEAILQAKAFFENAEEFALMTLYEQRIHRKTNKDLQLLLNLQATRQRDRAQARKQSETVVKDAITLLTMTAAAEGKQAGSTTYGGNGFAFSNPPEPQNDPAPTAKTGPEPRDLDAEILKVA
jgi:hypothetical protein